MSDLARILMLHAHGGWYLDLDVIVLRNLAGLTNGVGCLQWGNPGGPCAQVPNGIMVFDKGHDYLAGCLKELLKRYSRYSITAIPVFSLLSHLLGVKRQKSLHATFFLVAWFGILCTNVTPIIQTHNILTSHNHTNKNSLKPIKKLYIIMGSSPSK
jgi:hypothetical protein